MTLSALKREKIDIDLLSVASLIEKCGLSATVPVDSDGALSLSFALALLCGVSELPHCDDFRVFLEEVSSSLKVRFILCWEVLEMEVGEDLVVWSERVGAAEVVRAIRSLAKTIEFS